VPHSKEIGVPEWVDGLRDRGLRAVVAEALFARAFAIRHGAREHAKGVAALTSADTALDQIADGRVTGDLACRKAAGALRKYNTAAECAASTAIRRARKAR
jgi:hypothetical protein